ncbi:MAG: cbb3-type cytochrome c oxidase subunit 3 [Betaproteobacteria bacterium]|nr:cbb3-type cytochrome c oxidase subunit 3 [Betaproteobacteria bacterium]
MTVVAFVIFVGIVWWTYSNGRKERFEQAEQAPFALPDTADGVSSDNSTKQETD